MESKQATDVTQATIAKPVAKTVKIKALRPITVGGTIREAGWIGEATEEEAKELTRKLPPGQTKGFATFMEDEVVCHDQTRAARVA